MSYSFSVVAPTKAEAKVKVALDFDTKVLKHQHVHAKDREAVIAVASAFIDLLPDDPHKDVLVSLYGHLGGDWFDGSLLRVTGGTVNCSVGLSERVK